jgi:murein DD-endopeptidase MepM/ murein hydrolase activator NlpD
MRKYWIVSTIVFLSLFSCKSDKKVLQPEDVIKPIYEYGYDITQFNVIKDSVRANETFSSILNKYGVSIKTIYKIDSIAAIDSIDLTNLKKDKFYTILTKQDTAETFQAFIYELDQVEYWRVDLRNSIPIVERVRKNITTKRMHASGIISGSLFQTLEEINVDPYVAIKLAEVYKYSIDFYKIQEGDKFKLIFDQQFIDDTIPYKAEKIYASYFEHKRKPFYAFGYVTDTTKNNFRYYDEEGRELKKLFLKSPIAFGRISSKYSMSRYVSIYGRHKPHLGTDFAAPIGTPILSTADGVVEESAYRGGNGNFVKVKHNSTYSTQYLHMSKRAVVKGQRVSQGQIIGYIGMTGSTTGPHVCYRFWKNGKQVDALKQKETKSEPLPAKEKSAYLAFIEPVKAELDSLGFKNMEKKKMLNE